MSALKKNFMKIKALLLAMTMLSAIGITACGETKTESSSAAISSSENGGYSSAPDENESDSSSENGVVSSSSDENESDSSSENGGYSSAPDENESEENSSGDSTSEDPSLGDTSVTSPMEIPDFIVEVETGRDPVVLQLTDTQIIDVAQARPGRGGLDLTFWATDQVEERCYDYITETIEATDPDLIILTGDIVYGEFDDSGSALVSLINFMEGFEIPWAPVFGNHDNESKKGVDWQCEQFENAEHCLFEQKELTGNGNYSVGIAQGGTLKRVFYMLDSNGCGAASAESLANGHTRTVAGFGQDQIDWYTEEITEIKKVSPDTKISFAYHIQQAIFEEAYEKYGFDQSQKYQDINIDTLENKAEGDFGYLGRQLKGPWDTNYSVWNGMKALGTDSVFVGHEHCNSASVVYEGVRFQFGQKSSEYDRFNCLNSDGSITGGYIKTGTSIIGGTVIPLSETDGTIKAPYIYLCGGDVDIGGDKTEKDPEVTVNGLQYGGVNVTSAEMYGDGAVTARGVVFDETTNAYEVTANSLGKLYVNVALMQGKTSFTFSVYMPSTSTTKLAGYGEFAIRVKPNESEPSLDGSANGYIDFDSVRKRSRVKAGIWKMANVYGGYYGFGGNLHGVCVQYCRRECIVFEGRDVLLNDVRTKPIFSCDEDSRRNVMLIKEKYLYRR